MTSREESIPFTSFDGFVKSLNFSTLSTDEMVIAKFAFAGFSEQQTQITKERQLATSLELTQLSDLIYGSRNKRRFSPGNFFPPGRYCSLVNIPSDGDDFGTMRGELNAYRDPIYSGYVHTVDYTGHQTNPLSSSYFLRDEAGAKRIRWLTGSPAAIFPHGFLILLYDLDKFKSHIGHTEFERFKALYSGAIQEECYSKSIVLEDTESGIVAPFLSAQLGWDIKKISVDKVIDLRLREVQNWFIRSFQGGILGLTWSHFPAGDFMEALPFLMSPRIGGGQLTSAFGIWAFLKGANGIIYPSARNDVRVRWLGGDLAEHRGWNFVDFRADSFIGQLETFRSCAEVLIGHPELLAWLEDELGWDLQYIRLFFENSRRFKLRQGGFEITMVTVLNDKIYAGNYAQRRSPWRRTDLPPSGLDEAILELLLDMIAIQESAFEEQL